MPWKKDPYTGESVWVEEQSSGLSQLPTTFGAGSSQPVSYPSAVQTNTAQAPAISSGVQGGGATSATGISGGGGQGGGGGGLFGGIFASGASTLNTLVNWIITAQQTKLIKESEAKQEAFSNKLFGAQQKQQRFANKVTEKQMKMAEEEFDFGKMKWGAEFTQNMTMWKQRLGLEKENAKREQMRMLAQDVANKANNDLQFKSLLFGLSRS